MPVTPSGIMSLPLAHLRTLVANCSSFQSWTGAANAAAAEAFIHLVNLPDDSLVRPYVLIDFNDKWKSQKVAEFQFEKRGELYLLFEDDVAVANQASEADAVFDFMNNVGAVLEEMMSLSGQNGYLNLVEIEINDQPERTTSEESEMNEDYYTASFDVVWSGI